MPVNLIESGLRERQITPEQIELVFNLLLKQGIARIFNNLEQVRNYEQQIIFQLMDLAETWPELAPPKMTRVELRRAIFDYGVTVIKENL